MSQNIIQVNYPQLRDVVQRLQRQADTCTELRTAVNRARHPLEQGGWIGQGAQAFFTELDSNLMPALDRLHNALTQGVAVVQAAIATFQAAEEEAARLFHAKGNVDPVSRTELSLGEKAEQRFQEPYMTAMLNRTWLGEGDPRLGWAMTVLRQDPLTDVDKNKALNVIAELRGLDRATVEQQYATFLQRRKEAKERGAPIEELMPVVSTTMLTRMSSSNPLEVMKGVLMPYFGVTQLNYMGSRDQLRFGQIVGDTLGIDAVFGAMLNPTGGMPGPGEWAIPTGESAVSYHAAFHDAGGFLKNHFDVGPGYNYLNAENRPADDPLTGHESGLEYWNAKVLVAKARQGKLEGGDVVNAIATIGGGSILGKISDLSHLKMTDVARLTLGGFTGLMFGI